MTKGDNLPERTEGIDRSISQSSEKPGLRVLLVEDNELHERFMLVLMDREGHAVAVARNGVEAVERFQEEIFDVVLMDCKMPELDGYEATRLIRDYEREKPGRKAVIIGVSAAAMKEEVQLAYASGMDYFLPKPLRIQGLRELLKGITRR